MNSTADFADYLIFDHKTLRKESTTFSLKFSPWWPAAYVTNSSPGSIGKRIIAELLLDLMDGTNISDQFLSDPKNNDKTKYRTIESQDSTNTEKDVLVNPIGADHTKDEFSGSVTVNQTVTDSFL